MGLTVKQERFCQLLVTESKTLTDAYIGSYNCNNMKQQSIYQLSSRLSKQVDIRYRINQLMEQISHDAVSKVVWDKQKIIEELSVNVDLGRETKQLAASNQALNLIGKAVGSVFEPDSVAVSVTGSVLHGLSDQVLDQLAAMASEPVAIDDTGSIEASFQILETEPDGA